nr:right-handed parallel beta-helix repeat-containing protein [Muribaculaceae bacterium]
INGYATRQSVIDAVRSFNPEDSPIANLGDMFADWCGDDAFGIDGRGTTRNASKMQPGAYDAGL